MATARAGAAHVVGLREFQRDLRAVDKKLPRMIREAGNDAAHVVVRAGKRKASSRPQSRKAAESLRPASEQRRAAVKLGGARYPFAMGAEFGSIQYRQFPPWRGNSEGAGYFLWPAIRETRVEFMEAYQDALDELTKTVFPGGGVWRRT